jgi:hypothetical protein
MSVGEELAVQMVECAPPDPPKKEAIPFEAEDASPVRQGFAAEIEHVGAQPPPV